MTLQDENPGQWVEDRCRELGISVSRVAEEAGVNRSTIHRWKRCDTKRPYFDTLDSVRTVIDGYWSRHKAGKGA